MPTAPPARSSRPALLVLLLGLFLLPAPLTLAQQKMPSLDGATEWFNSSAINAQQLKGKVVLVDFWTYSCINCLRSLPYLKAWDERYRAAGLVIIGVHSPEFDFEKNSANIARAIHRFNLKYPVANDSNMAIWQAFNNQYWPAHYFIDRSGHIRYHHFGEGNYDESERWIRELLTEGGHTLPQASPEHSPLHPEEMAANLRSIGSPETYIGSYRARNFSSPGGLKASASKLYSAPRTLELNQWGFTGHWSDHSHYARLDQPGGNLFYHFLARDLHLVLGSKDRPTRFKVTLDGHEPGPDHGADCDNHGFGTVTDERLYQLIRLDKPGTSHIFRIEFIDAGVRAFSFTFG